MNKELSITSSNIISSNVTKFKQAQTLSKEQAKEIMKTVTLPKHLVGGDEDTTLSLLSLAIGQCHELGLPPMTYYSKFYPVNGSMHPSIHVWYHKAAKNFIEVDVIEDRAIVNRPVIKDGEESFVKDYRTTVAIRYKNKELGTVENKQESVYWSEIIKAGLDKKEAYVKYPGIQMRHWCFRNLIRTCRQDILSGSELYTAEEIMDINNINYTYDSEGNLIN